MRATTRTRRPLDQPLEKSRTHLPVDRTDVRTPRAYLKAGRGVRLTFLASRQSCTKDKLAVVASLQVGRDDLQVRPASLRPGPKDVLGFSHGLRVPAVRRMNHPSAQHPPQSGREVRTVESWIRCALQLKLIPSVQQRITLGTDVLRNCPTNSAERVKCSNLERGHPDRHRVPWHGCRPRSRKLLTYPKPRIVNPHVDDA